MMGSFLDLHLGGAVCIKEAHHSPSKFFTSTDKFMLYMHEKGNLLTNKWGLILLNTTYKILTKLYQLQLVPVLQDFILAQQSAFLPGRSFHDPGQRGDSPGAKKRHPICTRQIGHRNYSLNWEFLLCLPSSFQSQVPSLAHGHLFLGCVTCPVEWKGHLGYTRQTVGPSGLPAVPPILHLRYGGSLQYDGRSCDLKSDYWITLHHCSLCWQCYSDASSHPVQHSGCHVSLQYIWGCLWFWTGTMAVLIFNGPTSTKLRGFLES